MTWRAKIGLILPSSNTTMEAEAWRLVPPGVTVHTARVRLSKVNPEELLAMESEAASEARKLATLRPDILVYGCTTGSLIAGPGHDERIANTISEAAGAPAIATATAVVRAAHALGAEKIALLTPYIREVHEREIEFLEANGLEIVADMHLGIEDNTEIGNITPWSLYRPAKKLLAAPTVQALFISCTNLRTIEVIDYLEKDTGKPVYSSNTATIWLALKTLDINEPGLPAGRLLKQMPRPF